MKQKWHIFEFSTDWAFLVTNFNKTEKKVFITSHARFCFRLWFSIILMRDFFFWSYVILPCLYRIHSKTTDQKKPTRRTIHALSWKIFPKNRITIICKENFSEAHVISYRLADISNIMRCRVAGGRKAHNHYLPTLKASNR